MTPKIYMLGGFFSIYNTKALKIQGEKKKKEKRRIREEWKNYWLNCQKDGLNLLEKGLSMVWDFFFGKWFGIISC